MFDEGFIPNFIIFFKQQQRYIQMFISNTQQLRNEFVRRSFENKSTLTADQFVISLAQDNIFISIMTAMMVSGDFTSLEAQQVMEQELVTAWYLRAVEIR